MKRSPLRRFSARLKKRLMGLKVGWKWESDPNEPLKRRIYKTYDTYLAHQKLKLSHYDVTRHDIKFRDALRERLAGLPFDWKGMSVICLGARVGAEVKAFHDLGAFAVGIDLNPGPENPLVLYGDFHDLKFPDGSVDLVYTNALDHTFELDRMLGEVWRVLSPEGRFLAEAAFGEKQGREPRFYESCWWTSTEELLNHIQQCGFALESKGSFDVPWEGEQFVLKRAQRPAQPSA